jgi:hypothetical protein
MTQVHDPKSCYERRMIPERQIRASYTDITIRIYRAYSDAIADAGRGELMLQNAELR